MGVLLAVGLLLAQAIAHPAVARAASDPSLSYVSSAVYELQPAKRAVHATASFTVATRGDASGATRWFWDGVSVSLPPSTKNFVATAGQARLPLVVASSTANEIVVAVGFGRRIFAPQTFAFQLQFDIVDQSTEADRDLRITRTLSSFPVFALASPGSSGSSVTVRFPAGYEVTQDTGRLQRKDGSAGVTYSATSIGEDDFFAWFTAQTQPQLVDRDVSVGPLRVTIRGWDDDRAWSDRVQQILKAAYPLLRDQIGLGELPQMSLTVDEITSRDNGGYNGTFQPDSGSIQISYFADPFTIVHEMAHLWFNEKLAGDLWIDEGFASFYAERTLSAMNMTGRSPVLNDRKLAGRIPLNDWSPAGAPTLADEYAYAASVQAAILIDDLATDAGLRRVWNEMRNGTAVLESAGPLPAASSSARRVAPLDWRGFLDLLQATTGQSYDAIWRDWVVDPTQAQLLDRRDAARSDYAEAVALAGDWKIPAAVADGLRTWDFGQVEADVTAIRRALAADAQIRAGVAAESTTAPATLRSAFETSVGDGLREATAALVALEALTDARLAQTRDAGTTKDVGLIGANPSATLKSARQAFARGDWEAAQLLAEQARSVWDGAATEGRNRVLVVVASVSASLLVLLILIALLLSVRSRDTRGRGARPADASVVSVDARLAAAEATRVPADAMPVAAAATPPIADATPVASQATRIPAESAAGVGAARNGTSPPPVGSAVPERPRGEPHPVLLDSQRDPAAHRSMAGNGDSAAP